jgi:tRNA threonylcarbamoyladenosine biosynthesis protein TsaB
MTDQFDNMLAIDTSGKRLILALAFGGDRLVQCDEAVERSHGVVLMKRLQDLFQSAGLDKRELGAIAVMLGPGSFTGLRIGIAAAKGIAVGLGIPVVGVHLFEMFAASCGAAADTAHLLVPSRKGEWYVGTMRNGIVELDDITIVSDADVPARVEGDPVYGVGIDPAEVFAAAELDSRGQFAYSGSDIIHLGRSRLQAGAVPDIINLEPMYLQKAIAETRFDQRHGHSNG